MVMSEVQKSRVLQRINSAGTNYPPGGVILSRETGANKLRVDINVTAETKQLLDRIIDLELQDDKRNDRPDRSKSEILEMVLRKGAKTWLEARVT